MNALMVALWLVMGPLATGQDPRPTPQTRDPRVRNPEIHRHRGPGLSKSALRPGGRTLSRREKLEFLAAAQPVMKFIFRGDYTVSPNRPMHEDWIALVFHSPWVIDGGLPSYALFSRMAPPDPLQPIPPDQAADYWFKSAPPVQPSSGVTSFELPNMRTGGLGLTVPDVLRNLKQFQLSEGPLVPGTPMPPYVPGFVQLWIKPKSASKRFLIEFDVTPDILALTSGPNAALFDTYAKPYIFRVMATNGQVFSMTVPKDQLTQTQHFMVMLEPTDTNWQWYRLECRLGPWLFHRVVITELE